MLQAHEITHPDWIRFHGSSEINGDKITLRANVGGGAFEMRVSDVWISGEIVCVRNNAPATVTEHPSINTRVGISLDDVGSDGCTRQDDCPSGCCSCIGAVRVCCGSGGTRGFCLGVWGCPG